MIGEHRVTTYGLTDEENNLVKKNFPASDYDLLDTDAPTDIIAISASAIIINAAALATDDREMLFDYYKEVFPSTDETVIWLGEPKPPKELTKYIKYYDCFDDIADKLKYILLTAHTKSKKAADYSKRLTEGIMILDLIRKKPGIKTQDIADTMELSLRAVQRYIASLQATGEWIVYDHQLKGWKLFHGISVLFGDDERG